MKIQYDAKGNGTLLVRDPETKRAIVLHDAFWHLEGKREGTFNVPRYNSPIIDVPERIFEGLYSGIRRWHKIFTRDLEMNTEVPPASNFKRAIEKLENELVELLKEDGRADLCWYFFHKEISFN